MKGTVFTNVVTPDSLACNYCATKLLTVALIKWWRHQVNDLHVIQGFHLKFGQN